MEKQCPFSRKNCKRGIFLYLLKSSILRFFIFQLLYALFKLLNNSFCAFCGVCKRVFRFLILSAERKLFQARLSALQVGYACFDIG